MKLQNRGLRYGDGFFDTMLLLGGEPVWAQAHWDRMISAARTLDIAWPNMANTPELNFKESINSWLELIHTEWVKVDRPLSAKVRTLVWRAGDGEYAPLSLKSQSRILVHPLDLKVNNTFRLGPSSIVQCPPVIPWIKSLSAMPYIMAANFAKKQGWDDSLLINSQGQFIESSHSNLFFWLDGICFSPSITEGCLPGITAQYLNKFLSKKGVAVEYSAATYDSLRSASAIWLTNSIRGVTQVHFWDDQPIGKDRYWELAAAANAEIRGGSELI